MGTSLLLPKIMQEISLIGFLRHGSSSKLAHAHYLLRTWNRPFQYSWASVADLAAVYSLTHLGLLHCLLLLLSLPRLFSRHHTYYISLLQIQLIANDPVQVPNVVPFPLLPIGSLWLHLQITVTLPSALWCLLTDLDWIISATCCTHSLLTLPSASASFLLGLLFDPEDGGNMFLWNVRLSLNYRNYNPEGHTLQSVAWGPQVQRYSFVSRSIILMQH